MSGHSLTSEETLALFKRYVIPNYNRYPVNLVRGSGSVVWDSEAIKEVKRKVLPNTREFLALYGMPEDYWPNPFE